MFNQTDIRNLLLALSVDPKDTFRELGVGINSFYHRYDRILGRVSTHLKRCLIVFPEKAISYVIIYPHKALFNLNTFGCYSLLTAYPS